MSDLDRLRNIIETLPPEQIRALLTLLAPASHISDEEFRRRLEAAGEADIDEETATRLLDAEAEPGEVVSHARMKQLLGL